MAVGSKALVDERYTSAISPHALYHMVSSSSPMLHGYNPKEGSAANCPRHYVKHSILHGREGGVANSYSAGIAYCQEMEDRKKEAE